MSIADSLYDIDRFSTPVNEAPRAFPRPLHRAIPTWNRVAFRASGCGLGSHPVGEELARCSPMKRTLHFREAKRESANSTIRLSLLGTMLEARPTPSSAHICNRFPVYDPLGFSHRCSGKWIITPNQKLAQPSERTPIPGIAADLDYLPSSSLCVCVCPHTHAKSFERTSPQCRSVTASLTRTPYQGN
jgi:hypothetical protein